MNQNGIALNVNPYRKFLCDVSLPGTDLFPGGQLLRSCKALSELLAIYCIVMIGLNLRVYSAEYVVEGTISYEIHSPHVEQRDDFTVTVKDHNWQVKKVPQKFLKRGVEQLLADYSIISSDGTNFYQVSSRDDGKTISCRIGPGSIPFCLSDPKTIVLWYAFASGNYFPNITDGYVNPPSVFAQEHYSTDFRVKALWKLEESPPFLPITIAFDNVPKSQGGSNSSKQEAQLDFTNALLVVHDRKIANGYIIPQSATFKFFMRNRTNQTVVNESARMRIELKNVKFKSEVDSFQPVIAKFATVSDMRTITSNTPFGVAYFQQPIWPSFAASVEKARALTVSKGKNNGLAFQKSNLLRLGLFMVSVVPVLGLLTWQLVKTKKHNRL